MDVPYLVFSWEHNGFWRAGRLGYTRLIEEAGRYSKEEAEAICRNALPSTYRPSAGEPPEICFPAPEAFDQLQTVVRELGRCGSCGGSGEYKDGGFREGEFRRQVVTCKKCEGTGMAAAARSVLAATGAPADG